MGRHKHDVCVNVEMKYSLSQKKVLFQNSNLTPSGKFDINMKCMYGMRTIGKGLTAGNVLYSLSCPLLYKKYDVYCTESVSYTHLDVYKRQAVNNQL